MSTLSRTAVKTKGNASSGSAPVKKPRYTRGGKRFGFMLAFGIIAVICCFWCDHVSALTIGSAVGLAGTKLGLLYASPDGSVKSGRAGSVVYMRNGRRRNFVVPSLVQNPYTQTIRNRFGTNSNAWSGLTGIERNSWNTAVGFTYIDRFGSSHVLKGKALYVRLNQNLANAGAPLITSAPLPEDIAGLDTLTPTATTTTLTFTFAPTPTPASTNMLIFATTSLPAGFSRPSASLYRLVAVGLGSQVSPQDIFTNYTAKFGAPVSGAKIFIKVIMINNTTGQASPANIGSDIVA